MMLREIYIRHGRENLGFAWVFCEPLMFVFPVLTMWHYIRPEYAESGVLWADVSWSGYLPLMLYRHLGGISTYVVRFNSMLLFHRCVTPLDLLAAKTGVEVISNIAAAFFSLFVLVGIGEMSGPVNWPMLFVGYFYMVWWCTALALVIGGLSERTVWVEKIWIPAGYMYVALSGCFYMAEWLPPGARRIALLQPSLQAYEMIRFGMFGNKIPTYYDFTYTTLFLAVLTIVGLSAMRNVRKYVVFG